MDHSTKKGQFEAQHASGTDAGLTGANDAEMHHRRSSSTDFQADQALEALGYKPELSRSRSTLQVAFMSFVLASIPYGLATTLYYPLIGGGPVNIIWGWLGVSMIIVCVAASLGEITSVYPTAGGMLCLVIYRRPSPRAGLDKLHVFVSWHAFRPFASWW